MVGKYRALLIGNSTYPADEHNLQTLKGPIKDIAAVNRALIDADTGLFADADVTLLPEATSARAVRALGRFFAGAERDDVLLMYFSGHGKLDQSGRLHLCMQDTETTDLLSTAVSNVRINEFADASRARHIVIILDCCYAGAFRGGDLVGAVAGPGRYVLSSCRGTQLANDATVENGTSYFTQHLVDGLLTAADQDGDGYVGFSDLYAYVDRRLRDAGKQIPARRVDGDGDLRLAKRPPRDAVRSDPGPTPDTAAVPLAAGGRPIPAPVGPASPGPARADGSGPATTDGSGPPITDGSGPPAASGSGPPASDGSGPPATDGSAPSAAGGTGPPAAGGAGAPADGGSGPPDGGRSGPPAGDGAGSPPPPGPVAVGTPRGRWPRRRLLALALAAAVVVIAGAAGAVVLLRPDDARDGSTAASGTYNATGPWRLRVDGTGYGQGCTVSLTNTTSGTDVPLPRDLYGVARFQVAGSGSFRWQSNDAQCLVTPLAGSGTATLPMLQELDGDTDAIEAPGKLAVQIVDNKGSNCTLRLFDATNGQALDIVKWEAGDGDVTLDPLDRQTVYISDDNCIIRVSAAT